MGCGVMEAIATKVEAITDDDDDLSSLCIWFDRGGISPLQEKWVIAISSVNFWIR